MKRILFTILVSLTGALFSTVGLCEGDAKGQDRVPVAQSTSAQHPDADAPAERIGLLLGKTLKAGFEQPQEAPVRPRRIEMSGLLGILRRVPQQYPTIQAGINASVHGDTVLVSEGTYFENIKYRGKRIIIASLYLLDQDTSHISRTIIDGSQGVDTGSVVCFVSGEDTNSVLCGFTVRGGYGTYISSFGGIASGGGVYLFESGGRLVRNIITGNNVYFSNNVLGGGVSIFGLNNVGQMLIMEHNVVKGNTVTGEGTIYGAGVSILRSQFRLIGNVFENDTSRASLEAGGSGIFVINTTTNNPAGIIRDNVFRANVVIGDSLVAACVALINTEAVVVDGNIFEDNVVTSTNSNAYGGAIYVGDNIATSLKKQITRNVIRRNRLTSTFMYTYGGAMMVWDASVKFAENLIQDNTSQAGGAITYGGGIYGIRWGGSIENNIIIANTGTYGGGVGHTGAPPSGITQAIVNNTVCRNQAEFGGGLWGSSTATSILLNNIFWDDSSSNGEIYSTGTVEAHYSNIEGGWGGGMGNINVNPRFADTLYRLANASLCIGSGGDSVQIAGTWYRAPVRDFGNSFRPFPAGSHPDMGARESSLGTPTSVGDGEESMPSVFELAQNYPNPFNPSTTIRFSIPVGTYGHTSLQVYNLLGQEIATLVNEERKPGAYTVEWNAAGVASGVYFYRLTAGSFVETKKMVLMK